MRHSISAAAWNRAVDAVQRKELHGGPGARVTFDGSSYAIALHEAPVWRHPWSLSTYYWKESETGKGEWRARVMPGFVNGMDTVIPTEVPKAKSANSFGKVDAPSKSGAKKFTDVSLAAAQMRQMPSRDKGINHAEDEEFPSGLDTFLRFTDWFDPLAIQINDSGLASGSFPFYFRRLGVKFPRDPNDLNPLRGGVNSFTANQNRKEAGTRRLMSCDVVLNVDHAGSSSDILTSAPITGNIVISSEKTVAAMNRWPYRLITAARYRPIEGPDALERLFGDYTAPNFTQLLMSRLWMVSPEKEPDGTLPDARWAPYVQYFVYWNVEARSPGVFDPVAAPDEPLRFNIPIGLGEATRIGNSFLSTFNDAFALARTALNSQQPGVYFWTI